MKIRMQRNIRKGTISVRFSAEKGSEGTALANAVMAVGLAGDADTGLPARICEELVKNGVGKADLDLKVVAPKRRQRGNKPDGQ